MLGIALLYRLGRRLYDFPVGTLSALFLALSPYDLLFARTAFTDSMLVMWMLAALCAVVAGRWFVAGIALGLAFATKQHALFTIPLVVAVGWVCTWQGRGRRSRSHGHFMSVRDNRAGSMRLWVRQALQAPLDGARFRSPANSSPGGLLIRAWNSGLLACALGFALPLVGVIAWDAARWADRPGYWQQSASSYGGLAWAPATEWGERLVEWAGWARYLAGSWGLAVPTALGMGALLVYGWRQRPRDRRTWMDTLLVAYAAGYAIAHTVLRFSIWDRYLLPLAPLVALLMARVVTQIGQATRRGWETAPTHLRRSQRVRDSRWQTGESRTRRKQHRACGMETAPTFSHRSRRVRDSHPQTGESRTRREHKVGREHNGRFLLRVLRVSVVSLLLLSSLLSGWTAARNGYPIGGEHWAYQGLDQVADYLKENAPRDAVLYHHWLRWHYTYYLYDTDFELRWWESGEHLRREALRTPERAQYIVLPDWRTTEPDTEGIALRPLYETRRQDGSVSLTVYRVEPRQLASPVDRTERQSE
jgi:hypothetical protein